MTQNEIKQTIDSCIGKGCLYVNEAINSLMDEVFPYILHSYDNSRTIVQYTVGQLDRVHNHAVCSLMSMAINHVHELSVEFGKYSSHETDYIDVKWTNEEILELYRRIMPMCPKDYYLIEANMAAANSLTDAERRKMASFITDSIQHFSTDAKWNKRTLENHQLQLGFLYAICKKDCQMQFLFWYANNFIDRLATSGEAQAARDMAETMLMIGHKEGMEAEAYFCAARAYTIVHNPLAGLFYMEIALRKWLQQNARVAYRQAFEVMWQMLKIARGIRCYSEKLLSPMVAMLDELCPPAYDVLSFHCTYLSLILYEKQDRVLDDVADFLDEHRELVFANLEHSALPWFTLISSVKMSFPDADLSRVMPYMTAFTSVVDKKTNAIYVDLFARRNEDVHLKELLLKLQETRNVSDFSHDNQLATLYAKMLLDKAAAECDYSKYVLAMHVLADFTFVKNEIYLDGIYSKPVFSDVKGNDFSLLLEDTEALETLMSQMDSDEVIWMGKGQAGLHYMSLLNDHFSFGDLNSLGRENLAKLRDDVISSLKYEPDVKTPNQTLYIKDVTELEKEAEELKCRLSNCKIGVSSEAKRLLMVKDMDMAVYPHQLLIDDSRYEFIGCLLPTCNIISTEVLIKTNFNNSLPKHPSCTFWSPVESQELTFGMIRSKLDDTFVRYNFSCNDQTSPDKPICSDINIACAHGGVDISDTQWFYADDKPIIEINRIIGTGKLLILFVCHSGSMSRPDYDNAMHTLIKRYIRVGYSSVIAPMWSLNTDILPTWLDAFMSDIMKGQYVIDALFNANMAVKSQYTSPEVYACMHLFGNPYLQIADRPRLEIAEKTHK